MPLYDANGNVVSQNEKLSTDTSPTFELINKGITTNGAIVNANGYGLTPIIKLDPPITSTEQRKIVFYIANSGTASAYGNIAVYANGTFDALYGMPEKNTTTKNINPATKPINGIRFALPMADIDDSYAYVKETGQVLFAGKNTAYYGKTNTAVSKFAALSTNYVNVLKQSYNALVEETDGNYNRIPVVVYTDQHQTFSDAKPIFHAINYFFDLSKISKIINLGDCMDWQGLLDTVKILPVEKQINVLGNHEIDRVIPVPSDHTPIMKYFPCGGGRQFNHNEWWSIIDEQRNVKYLVINDLEPPEGKSYTYFYMSTPQVRWVIDELEKADGYDVILCSHCHLDDRNSTKRDGTNSSGEYGEWPWIRDSAVDASFSALIAARKQKTSGTYTDLDGVSVSYDFTNCNSELLIMLSGHKHTESYKNLPNSICNYIFECFYDNIGSAKTIYIGYIDRVAKKFKNWKLYDGITAVDVQEIDIN